MESLIFQIADIYPYHEICDERECYVMQLFGRTKDDQDVCIKVVGFHPYFFIRIPSTFDDTDCDEIVKQLNRKAKYAYERDDDKRTEVDYSEDLMEYSVEYGYNFYGFNGEKEKRYLKLEFRNQNAFRKYESFLKYPMSIKRKDGKRVEKTFQIYESKIECMIRFFHITEVNPAGWVEINAKHLHRLPRYSYCDHCYRVKWNRIKPYTSDDFAPFKIAAYDIECISEDNSFPNNRPGDEIIMICITIFPLGSYQCIYQCALVQGKYKHVDGVENIEFENEKDLLLGFARKMRELRPDFRAGHNVFDFDDTYIRSRLLSYGENVYQDFVCAYGKLKMKKIMKDEGLEKSLTFFKSDEISSSGMGDNFLRYFVVPGIVALDTLKFFKITHRLTSNSLDYVSSVFISEEIKKYELRNGQLIIYTKNIKELTQGSYIHITAALGYDVNAIGGKKFIVKEILTGEKEGFIIDFGSEFVDEFSDKLSNDRIEVKWSFAKDDMHHAEMKKNYLSGDVDKIGEIVIYCLKDCILVNLLIVKLDIILNYFCMARVCWVPVKYMYLRGQGVRILSLIAYECRKKHAYIKTLEKPSDDVVYQGAKVFDPIPAIYYSPISVLDFSSLYPKTIIANNLSHECYVEKEKYMNLDGYVYRTIEFEKKDTSNLMEKHVFAQKIVNGKPTYGILSCVLDELLKARSATKKKIPLEKDPVKCKILDSMQNALKITANSIYGQTGAVNSAIFMLPISSCTTAEGRKMLALAKKTVEDNIPGSKIIYGDTDSIFINFFIKDEHGNELYDEYARKQSIILACQCRDLINQQVSYPHEIVYEKTYHPLIIEKKKRYTGIVYMNGKEDHPYTMSMGSSLKRRDYADIAKIIVGGITEGILSLKDANQVMKEVEEKLRNMLADKYPIEKFVKTRELKSNVKNANTLAQWVLAKRMELRDPGSKPSVGDRMQFVHILKKNRTKKTLQGVLIESVEYAKKMNCKLDYAYYIEKQIMKNATNILYLLIVPKYVDRFFEKYIKYASLLSMGNKGILEKKERYQHFDQSNYFPRLNNTHQKSEKNVGNKSKTSQIEGLISTSVEKKANLRSGPPKKRTIAKKSVTKQNQLKSMIKKGKEFNELDSAAKEHMDNDSEDDIEIDEDNIPNCARKKKSHH